jgi:tetratricopeptide (TPR) repeat protein
VQPLSRSAIIEAEKLLATDPANWNALLLLGRAAMAEQRYPEARRFFERAVAANPRAAKAHFMLGFCSYVDNDFRLALEPLKSARNLNPKDAPTALYLALTHQGLAEPALAKPHFEAAMELSSDPEIRLAYARALIEQGDLDKAQPLIAKALQLAPNSRDAHYEMARLKLETGLAAQAAAEAELALQLPSSGITDRQVHFLLAKAYAKLGDSAKAAIHRKAFEAIPPRLIR